MSTIYRQGKLVISVYVDHAPPHFHVRTPNGDAVVDLASMQQIAGAVDHKLFIQAIKWAIAHRSVILAEWKRLNGDYDA